MWRRVSTVRHGEGGEGKEGMMLYGRAVGITLSGTRATGVGLPSIYNNLCFQEQP